MIKTFFGGYMLRYVEQVFDTLEENLFTIIKRYREKIKETDVNQQKERLLELLGVDAENGNEMQIEVQPGFDDNGSWTPLSKGILPVGQFNLKWKQSLLKADKKRDWIDEFIDQPFVRKILCPLEKVDRYGRQLVGGAVETIVLKFSHSQIVDLGFHLLKKGNAKILIEQHMKDKISAIFLLEDDKGLEHLEDDISIANREDLYKMNKSQLIKYIDKMEIPIDVDQFPNIKTLRREVEKQIKDIGMAVLADSRFRKRAQKLLEAK